MLSLCRWFSYMEGKQFIYSQACLSKKIFLFINKNRFDKNFNCRRKLVATKKLRSTFWWFRQMVSPSAKLAIYDVQKYRKISKLIYPIKLRFKIENPSICLLIMVRVNMSIEATLSTPPAAIATAPLTNLYIFWLLLYCLSIIIFNFYFYLLSSGRFQQENRWKITIFLLSYFKMISSSLHLLCNVTSI